MHKDLSFRLHIQSSPPAGHWHYWMNTMNAYPRQQSAPPFRRFQSHNCRTPDKTNVQTAPQGFPRITVRPRNAVLYGQYYECVFRCYLDSVSYNLRVKNCSSFPSFRAFAHKKGKQDFIPVPHVLVLVFVMNLLSSTSLPPPPQ